MDLLERENPKILTQSDAPLLNWVSQTFDGRLRPNRQEIVQWSQWGHIRNQHRSFECFDWWLPTTSPSPNMGVSNALLVICRISNGHISAVGHVIPIHLMFWSRVEFSGSTERMALFWFYQTQDGGHDITWKDINDRRVMSPFAKLLWPFFT